MAAVDNCCLCWSLKTGCYIIGYLYAMMYSISILVLSGVLISYGITISAIYHTEDYQKYNKGMEILMGVGVVVILVLAGLLALSIVFLVGVNKGKRGYVKVFLVFLIIGVAFGAIGSLGSLLTLRITTILTNLISLAIQVYTMMVVQSYHETMGEVKPQAPKACA